MKSIKRMLLGSLVIFSLGAICIFVGAGFDGLDYVEAANIDDFPIKLDISPEEKEEIYKKVLTWEEALNANIDEYSMELGGIKSVDFDLIAATLDIRKTDKKEAYLEIHQYDKENYITSFEDNIFRIEEVGRYRRRENFITLNPLKEEILGNSREAYMNTNMVLYLPEDEYCDLKIDLNFGFISVEDVKTKHLELSLNSGDATVRDAEITNLKLVVHYGKTTLENVEIASKLEIINSSGDIILKDCEVDKAFFRCEYGDIDFYDLDLEKRLEINSRSGDITGSILFDDKKSYDLKLGDINGRAHDSDAATCVDDVFIDEKLLGARYKDREEVQIVINHNYGSVDIDAK